jgi:hemerythrin
MVQTLLVMMLFPWKDEYAINIKKIDEQHKKLVGYVNQLYQTMKSGNSNEVIGDILDGLVIYTVHHFQTEEKLMFKHGYSDYEYHKKQHEELEKKVKNFVEKYKKNEARLPIELADFLKNWLINHIGSSDKIMGKYLNTYGK